jgi:hypothetical protein
MCDAFDYAVGTVLGKQVEKLPHVIYYANKTLNDAQLNYSTTENELLVIVFALDKFRSYVLRSKVLVYLDHATLKYLLFKKDVNLISSIGFCYCKNLTLKSGTKRVSRMW